MLWPRFIQLTASILHSHCSPLTPPAFVDSKALIQLLLGPHPLPLSPSCKAKREEKASFYSTALCFCFPTSFAVPTLAGSPGEESEVLIWVLRAGQAAGGGSVGEWEPRDGPTLGRRPMGAGGVAATGTLERGVEVGVSPSWTGLKVRGRRPPRLFQRSSLYPRLSQRSSLESWVVRTSGCLGRAIGH